MKSLERLKDVIDGLFDENIRKNYKRKEVEKDLEQVYQDLEVLEIYKDYFTPEHIGIYEYCGKKYAYYEFLGTDHDAEIYCPEEIERFKQFKKWVEEQDGD